MAVQANPGVGGSVLETVQRVGTDHRQVLEEGYLPTFVTMTPNLTSTASRFQFVLYNNNASAIVQIRKVVWIPVSATTVVQSPWTDAWTMRRRVGPTTNPSGTGGTTIESLDSADTLPSSISGFSNPGTAPAGGTTQDLSPFFPQSGELVLTTLDAPTQTSGYPFAGVTLYEHRCMGPSSKPLTLRQDQCFEIQQGATAGSATSTWRIWCLFTVV